MVTYGFKWLHAIYVICLFIVVVCGLIWFHKVVYSQIWFHLVPTVAYCGLKLHWVANGCRWFPMGPYCFMLYFYILYVSLLCLYTINMLVAYCFSSLNIVANYTQ